MAVEGQGSDLVQVVALLGAAVVAVPLFKRMGLGSVLGYLAAGLAIGPFGLRLFSDAQAILHFAELGVVMFLFVIGLEMQPSRLWGLRREIFGLGAAQVALCGGLLTGIGILWGAPPAMAFVAAMGFVLSSTAIAMQLLDERGETSTPAGQKIVSILLLEDLAIVPLLAIVAFLAPAASDTGWNQRVIDMALAVGAIVGLVVAGRWLLNPLFRLLAAARAREIMTAAALLVVLGAALLMQLGGLSMAMGAFLAGVLLSESTFRHQLEADIEPFRGILLGLFFLAVGMSLDFRVIGQAWPVIMGAVGLYMAVKSLGIYMIARVLKADHREAITRAALMAQGGEFAFVLYSAAAGVGIFDAQTNAILTATVILSMALTPLLTLAVRRLTPAGSQSMADVDTADELSGTVLMIGFGRFGQVASQALLARGFEVAIIENDTEMIRSAADFGFKVYYGDGTRLDILATSGAGRAKAVLVCIDKVEASNRIVELMRAEYPLTRLFVRAFDREHALHLIEAGVDFHIRETFESAMAFGQAALVELGVPVEEAAEITDDVRRRDEERLELQATGGIYAGTDLMRGNVPRPGPLTQPKRHGQVVCGETATPLDEAQLPERAPQRA
ncbi:Kef-type potassium/proton antiporter (CPA2 family) [Stella humosa]|uniref:Kef-type potassium/proton antiporter (CPA2 family) n=1 Tax=Stella humosa TaxID=94 RepID=A0A3N1M3U5_9PROT|nr:monovalent cation:proton antiporter-2 (CPA2) family protein [Stella humosa]ROQ00412.1 Kef-type potassium/proton antiporter (CPA2 family) [Stella humosa]BBK30345.1 potassium efflux system protein [Stella humosa]